MEDLGTLEGGSASWGYGINNADQVVGTSDTSDGFAHAFLYDGVMHDLGTFEGGSVSEASDINDAGKVVGYADTSDGFSRAFLYDGVMHDLGTLEGGSVSEGEGSQGYGINNADQVVGGSMSSDEVYVFFHAFLYSDGVMQDLDTLGGSNTNSTAYGINDVGKVVGVSDAGPNPDGDQIRHAFLYSGGVMKDLNSLIPANSPWELTGAMDINSNGLIVGAGNNVLPNGKTGPTHAILLIPTQR